MTSKCKCGHTHDWHMFVKPPACDNDGCKCKKFSPEDEITNLRGSSLKQKKGCGKALMHEGDTWGVCGDTCNTCKFHLCPSCQNQSPVLVGQSEKSTGKDKPEDEPLVTTRVKNSSGIQSPQVKLNSSLEDTQTLSDRNYRFDFSENDDWYFGKHVKEAVKKLKEELKEAKNWAYTPDYIHGKINKIFGEKLTK